MNVLSDVDVRAWCTLGVGGAARWFCEAHDVRDIQRALAWANERRLPVFVLGGGSNIVLSDRGFDGLVLQVDVRGVSFAADRERMLVSAGAGEPWDALVAEAVRRGCAGLECLSGIPGLVGGTPIQNVGAYGQDVAETITSVETVDRSSGTVTTLSSTDCWFGYRTSRFKRQDRGRFVVSRVEFALIPNGAPRISYADVVAHFRDQAGTPSVSDVRTAVLTIRRRKGMVIEPGNAANRSVGSFFVNPTVGRGEYDRIRVAHSTAPGFPAGPSSVKIPAAWLIEHAGFPRGLTRGAVGVSPFQAQAIVNHGGATADDVLGLAMSIKRAVWDAFKVAIVPEPELVGFAPSADIDWLLSPRIL
jgi:UDP-N-acetylmuramate dehydrogenase